MDNLIGQNLGRYHVIEPLGQGGMASVYKAFDTSLERDVAIKIIRGDKKEGTEQNEFLKRFQREARALAQLDHPYILKVLDYGEQDGMPYLVMPFVKGGTLKEKMGAPMNYRQAASLLQPVAQALDYAHKRMIIHRDVKPANILISESGAPLLSDFGIAKIIEAGDSTQLTATGVGIGTPDYMAPEQWLGKADACTDIYSLGIVFYQLVTGRLPFSAETPAAVLIKHMQDPLPRPRSFVPSLPEAVEQVLYKALAKEPASRYQDMAAFAQALGSLASGDLSTRLHGAEMLQTVRTGAPDVTMPSAHRPATATQPQPLPLPAKKKGLPGWAIGLIVLGVIGVIVLFVVLAGGALLAASLAAKPNQPASAVPTSFPTSFPTSMPTAAPVGTLPFQVTDIFPTLDNSSSNPPFTSIEGLPADVPFLTDNNGDLMTSTSQGMTMYYYSTSMALQDVVDFYKTQMDANGWTVAYSSTQSGMQYWDFTKGDAREVLITIMSDESSASVQVGIILQ